MISPVTQAVVDFIVGEAAGAPSPLVIGLAGAQGSGKSTVAAEAARALSAQGLSCHVLALDDLYLTAADRRRLAAEVHPLLATRGPPGTHDVSLGLSILAGLKAGRPTRVPRFDKLTDDVAPAGSWPLIEDAPRVILFEGWCMGASPQPSADLVEPINALEAADDRRAEWRGFVNARLATDYAALFGELDRLIFLRAPGFDVVRRWRGEQEENAVRADRSSRGMEGAAMDRFVAHYERLTRWMLREIPGRADLVIDLDGERHLLAVHRATG
ncbi:kinase [soil metagenome]